jgi:membrane protein
VPLAIAFFVALAWGMYKFLPNACFSNREAFLAAVVATFLWIIVTILFRLYVQHFGSYNAVYGTIGAVIILLTWMYLSMLAVIVAGDFGAVVHRGVGHADATAPAARAARSPVDPAPMHAAGRDS